MAARKDDAQRRCILADLDWHLKEMGVLSVSTTPVLLLGKVLAYWRLCRNALTSKESLETLHLKMCPIVAKFPENVVSRLNHYGEPRRVAEDILTHAGMDQTMMWRLLLFIFLGCGGNGLIPWERLRNLPCEGDPFISDT